MSRMDRIVTLATPFALATPLLLEGAARYRLLMGIGLAILAYWLVQLWVMWRAGRAVSKK
jgi:hypothetical protein